MRLQRTLVPPPSPSNSSDDARLVARVRAGEPAALGELYSRYARPLFGLAQRLMGPEQDAEDVLHDVFLGLPVALRQYEEQGSLDAWLKRVTARVALNRLRSHRRRTPPSSSPSPSLATPYVGGSTMCKAPSCTPPRRMVASAHRP